MPEKVELGNCVLYHADCLEVLPTLANNSVDAAIVSDPPYGIKFQSHGMRFRGSSPIQGDDSLELAEVVRNWARELSLPVCMFFSPYKPMTGWRNVLCWDKGAHVGIGGDRRTCWKRDFEMIGVERNGTLAGKRDSAVLRFRALSPPPTGHFAEKPVPLMEYLVTKLDAPTVIDPFMGSGSTAVACVRTGRKFIGIELERKYFDIACDRIAKELNQAQLFSA